MDHAKPIIYLIDDESQTSDARRMSNLYGVDVEYLYPTAVTPAHLERASLFAVDQNLLLREGGAPDDDLLVDPLLPTALVPEDGVALCAVFRSAAKKVRRDRPLGFAIRSGALDEMTAGLPQDLRQPLVADQHDLEWIVAKESGTPDPDLQLVALAHALATYPTQWGSEPARDLGIRWLGVPNERWADAAKNQIGHCRPPVEVASSSAHGLAWLRWLAHQILPFPTFVISDIYASACLGVTVQSLRTFMGDDDAATGEDKHEVGTAGPDSLRQALVAARYRGPLAQMHETRFWRAGVDSIVAEFTSGARFSAPGVIAKALVEAGMDLIPVDVEDPVVVIDENYAPALDFVDRGAAVRLTPDGWPPYADPAWADPARMSGGDVQRLSLPLTR